MNERVYSNVKKPFILVNFFFAFFPLPPAQTGPEAPAPWGISFKSGADVLVSPASHDVTCTHSCTRCWWWCSSWPWPHSRPGQCEPPTSWPSSACKRSSLSPRTGLLQSDTGSRWWCLIKPNEYCHQEMYILVQCHHLESAPRGCWVWSPRRSGSPPRRWAAAWSAWPDRTRSLGPPQGPSHLPPLTLILGCQDDWNYIVLNTRRQTYQQIWLSAC